MQYLQSTFLADDPLFDDDALPKDEIDDLFEKLQPIEPPPDLIQRILNSISRLPPPPQLSQPEDDVSPSAPLDRLIVRNDKRPAS